jgi:hypothetical protein
MAFEVPAEWLKRFIRDTRDPAVAHMSDDAIARLIASALEIVNPDGEVATATARSLSNTLHYMAEADLFDKTNGINEEDDQ